MRRRGKMAYRKPVIGLGDLSFDPERVPPRPLASELSRSPRGRRDRATRLQRDRRGGSCVLGRRDISLRFQSFSPRPGSQSASPHRPVPLGPRGGTQRPPRDFRQQYSAGGCFRCSGEAPGGRVNAPYRRQQRGNRFPPYGSAGSAQIGATSSPQHSGTRQRLTATAQRCRCEVT